MNYKNKDNNNSNGDPKKIQLMKELTKDSYSYKDLDNTFCFFKSFCGVLCLVYSNENISIIALNIITDKIIIEIKNAHNYYISNFRYFFDNNTNRDLIISISADDNNIKLWNCYNWECIKNFKNINEDGILLSACFLRDNKYNYIITSNCNYEICESIKVFDFKGNKKKEINDSKENTYFIDIFYDNQNKIYIITGTRNNVTSYDYKENKIYQKYISKENYCHNSVIVNDKKEKVELLDSCEDGHIRIWDFHTAELIKEIQVLNEDLCGILLWGNEYLFTGGENKTMILIELRFGETLRILNENKGRLLTIKKINHPQYGQCIITQSNEKSQIKLWIIKN